MDTGFLNVLGMAFLPALGNFGGGLLAEWLSPSQKTLNRALHVAAGIIIAVIAVEVMPDALSKASAWVLALAFVGGGCLYILAEGGIEWWQQAKQGGTGVGTWMVYVAVATDLVGDGLLIGAGSAVSTQLALSLAIGQVMADVPEGFAVIATFRDKGVDRAQRLLLAASFAIPVLGAAVLAYLLLRNQSEVFKVAAMVAVGGLYSLAAVEDMLREAHESAEDSRWSAISFIGGFALFLVASNSSGQQ